MDGADLVELPVFSSREELVNAVCEQGSEAFPKALTVDEINRFLEHVRILAGEKGHARLSAQIYAEAALSPALASVVAQQLASMRAAVSDLIPAARSGYSQQLSVRGDLDPKPFTSALMALVQSAR